MRMPPLTGGHVRVRSARPLKMLSEIEVRRSAEKHGIEPEDSMKTRVQYRF
ncbi:hypothetical protein IW254_000203 [Corynebacterium aquatimens]|uniref:Uncharacterized protein n=1 Tax=Corynebacterium aquatimens TaxID=1190508 RepID=A0A931DYB1_9CORY|nr:hypothetical protein [Corynebacterium aquatimens]